MAEVRTRYTKAFKLKVVELSLRPDSPTKSEIAHSLGLEKSLYCRWCREYNSANPFPGNGNPKDRDLYERRKREREAAERSRILGEKGVLRLKSKGDIFRFIERKRGRHYIIRMTKTLGVTQNGYYLWRQRQNTPPELPLTEEPPLFDPIIKRERLETDWLRIDPIPREMKDWLLVTYPEEERLPRKKYQREPQNGDNNGSFFPPCRDSQAHLDSLWAEKDATMRNLPLKTAHSGYRGAYPTRLR